MLNFKKKFLRLDEPLSFWKAFAGVERVYFYDTQNDLLVMAAERLSNLTDETEIKKFPYVFYSQTFFGEKAKGCWAGLGNELLAFKHYFVKKGEESCYYYLDRAVKIPEIQIQQLQHKLTELTSKGVAATSASQALLTNWQTLFSEAKKSIATGFVKKVVASRQLIFESDKPFQFESILYKLIKNNLHCFIFAYAKGERVFFGASPELLVRKDNQQISSIALAGTLARSAENRPETLLNDPKELLEHQIVIDQIRQKMLKVTETVKIGPTEILSLKNVYHLQTKLEAVNSDKSLIDWAKLLHPTPAIGGEPVDTALQLIRRYEGYERGLYASPFGLIDSAGNGSLIVAIRSALIVDKKLFIFAGGGITADSVMEAELSETQAKLKTILEAL